MSGVVCGDREEENEREPISNEQEGGAESTEGTEGTKSTEGTESTGDNKEVSKFCLRRLCFCFLSECLSTEEVAC